MSKTSSTQIMLPLYIYPHPGAWDPLYAVLEKYAYLNFIVILNPSSGPGAEPWWPNEDYTREVPRLNAYPNVTTVGYVRADYCKRDAKEAHRDIITYAMRTFEDVSKNKVNGWGLSGIFLDETVNLYSEEAKSWLDSIDRKVKSCCQFGERRIVIHNPGTSVSKGLADPGPDITTTIETSYVEYLTKNCQDWLATSPYGREQSCYMVHSVPIAEIVNVTRSLSERAKYLFVTDSTSAFYQSFGPSWDTFVATMAAL